MKQFVNDYEIQIAIEPTGNKRVHVLDTATDMVEYFEVLRGETDREAIERIANELKEQEA